MVTYFENAIGEFSLLKTNESCSQNDMAIP